MYKLPNNQNWDRADARFLTFLVSVLTGALMSRRVVMHKLPSLRTVCLKYLVACFSTLVEL